MLKSLTRFFVSFSDYIDWIHCKRNMIAWRCTMNYVWVFQLSAISLKINCNFIIIKFNKNKLAESSSKLTSFSYLILVTDKMLNWWREKNAVAKMYHSGEFSNCWFRVLRISKFCINFLRSFQFLLLISLFRKFG